VLWLAWGSELYRRARCRAVLLCSGKRGALQKRTPPCCCALAGVALCGSARRRAVAHWVAWHSAEARAAVLLLLRAAALFPPGCCGHSTEAHAAVLARPGWRRGGRAAWRRRSFSSTDGGVAAPSLSSRRPGSAPRALAFGPACGATEMPAAPAADREANREAPARGARRGSPLNPLFAVKLSALIVRATHSATRDSVALNPEVWVQ
jgi:hypothetical protein